MSRSLPQLLIVHESARSRSVLGAAIGQGGVFATVTAGNQSIARAKLGTTAVHAVLMQVDNVDDHCAFIRELRDRGLPVVAMTSGGTDGRMAVAARASGAFAIFAAPEASSMSFADDTLDTLLADLHSHLLAQRGSGAPRVESAPASLLHEHGGSSVRDAGVIIAIGASTGGPDALTLLLPSLPLTAPPVLLVQHMPANATRSFAERLNEICAVEVREACAGDTPQRGQVLVAPGGRHMRLRQGPHGVHVELSERDNGCAHKPCVDELFQSMATEIGARGIGVLLTGMGNDGARGLLAMRQNGARTVAQNRATCAVFGMPARAIERGAAMAVLPLKEIVTELLRYSGMRAA